MLNIKFKSLLIISLYLATTNSFAERVLSTKYFKNIAISETDTYDLPKKLSYKIVVQEIIKLSKKEITNAMDKSQVPYPKLGETIWTITPEMLPATADTCIDADLLPCTIQTYNTENPLASCYNSCIQYGPKFLAYDEERQKIYIMADTQEVGQAGGRFLGFVADLKTKKN